VVKIRGEELGWLSEILVIICNINVFQVIHAILMHHTTGDIVLSKEEEERLTYH
jgi:hypothetical protein